MTSAELRDRRVAAGMTQQRLAELVGVSRPAVVQWETGARPVPRARVGQIVGALRRGRNEARREVPDPLARRQRLRAGWRERKRRQRARGR